MKTYTIKIEKLNEDLNTYYLIDSNSKIVGVHTESSLKRAMHYWNNYCPMLKGLEIEDCNLVH